MRTSHLLVVIGALLLAGLAGLSAGTEQRAWRCGDRPNVIVVDADTLRARSLGVYGSEGNTSPAIDRFASRSIVFERAIAQSTWTLPSVMSIMLSRYPDVHRLGLNSTPGDRTTWADRMRALGYRTGAFLEVDPRDGRRLYRQGFDTVRWERKHGFRNLTEQAIDWLAKGCDRAPAFAYVLAKTLHDPYGDQAPPELRQRFVGSYDGILEHFRFLGHSGERIPFADPLGRIRWNGTALLLTEQYTGGVYSRTQLEYWLRGNWSRDPVIMERLDRINATHYRVVSRGHPVRLDERDIRYVRQRYRAEVAFFDRLFGRFLDRLRRRGLYEDSIVVLLSNHGENLAEHRARNGAVFGHRAPYAHTVHVPLIMRVPGHGHRRIEQPVELIDLQPTVLELVGKVRQPRRMQGMSLVPLLRGRRIDTGYQFSHGNMVRNRTWKLIDLKTGDRLYNLRKDPREQQNLIERRPAVFRALHMELERHRTRNRLLSQIYG